MSGFFFCHWAYFISKNSNLNVDILVKRPLEKLHLHPQWGPDTHNSPHQRGAVRKADHPIFCEEIPF